MGRRCGSNATIPPSKPGHTGSGSGRLGLLLVGRLRAGLLRLALDRGGLCSLCRSGGLCHPVPCTLFSHAGRRKEVGEGMRLRRHNPLPLRAGQYRPWRWASWPAGRAASPARPAGRSASLAGVSASGGVSRTNRLRASTKVVKKCSKLFRIVWGIVAWHPRAISCAPCTYSLRLVAKWRDLPTGVVTDSGGIVLRRGEKVGPRSRAFLRIRHYLPCLTRLTGGVEFCLFCGRIEHYCREWPGIVGFTGG